jgi:hypothetical protein
VPAVATAPVNDCAMAAVDKGNNASRRERFMSGT